VIAQDGTDRAGEGLATATPTRPPTVTLIATAAGLTGLAQVAIGLGMLGWVRFLGVPAQGDPEVTGWGALLSGTATVASGLSLLTLRRWAWILGVATMGITSGWAAWAVIRHGLDGTAWAALAAGVAASVLLACLLQHHVRRAFRA
jgi:hypothetical protein